MKLNVKSFALTCGILWGLAVFIGTIWLLIIGASGKTISLLGAFYFGYQFSIGGAFVGLIWGFVDGAICGLTDHSFYRRECYHLPCHIITPSPYKKMRE